MASVPSEAGPWGTIFSSRRRLRSQALENLHSHDNQMTAFIECEARSAERAGEDFLRGASARSFCSLYPALAAFLPRQQITGLETLQLKPRKFRESGLAGTRKRGFRGSKGKVHSSDPIPAFASLLGRHFYKCQNQGTTSTAIPREHSIASDGPLNSRVALSLPQRLAHCCK
jgi:hypothetical protein